MNRIKRTLFGIALCTAAGVGGFAGTSLVRDVAPAHAETPTQQNPAGITGEQIAKVEDLANVFKKVGHQLEPSVVNINVRKSVKGAMRHPRMEDDMLRRFFRDRDGDGEGDLPPGFSPDGDFEQFGTGSGVIIETDGNIAYIVTNNHVAGGATEMVITLADGREVRNGKVLGADPKTDLALIKVEQTGLKAATWGDSSQLDRGDWVMAFGSPFGYVGSMTHGIVSALNRDQVGILRGGYENFIQVDAPINPGNSGGPLVNIRGEVVGINTAIVSRTGGFNGIGFAIPSNQAKTIVSQLKDKGKVVRGWLGVKIKEVNEPIARAFNFNGLEGVLVDEVYDKTPAIGKLQHGDIITKVNGKKVTNMTELRNEIAVTAPGAEAKMTVFRDGKTEDVSVKLGEQPDDLEAFSSREGGARGEEAAPGDQASETMGMTLSTLNDDLRQKFGLTEEQSGAVVTAVQRNSRAAKAGVMVGDLITEVGSAKVKTAKEARDALNKTDASKGLRLYVTNRGTSTFRFILPEDAEK